MENAEDAQLCPALLHEDKLIRVKMLKDKGILNQQQFEHQVELILNRNAFLPVMPVSEDELCDVSSQLYKDLTAPFNAEPSFEELRTFLCADPLVQFPVHSSIYKRLAKILPAYLMKIFFRSSSSECCNIDGNLINLAQMKVQLDRDGESTLHYYVDSLIKEVLQKILSFEDLSTYTSRDVADASNTTGSKLRPDFLFYVNQFLILRGEEKKKRGELVHAKGELIDKLKSWNALTFGNLKYILGFACAGEAFVFCAISSSCKLCEVSRTFDLEIVVDRFEILIRVINLARLFRTLAHRIPQENIMLFKPLHRSNGCIVEIRDGYVLKKIPVSAHEFQETYDYLEKLYRIMISERVPHVIERWGILVKRRGDAIYIELKLRPCGLEIVPTSVDQLLSALRSIFLALEGIHKLGYVHRDIRWPNILWMSEGDWRLIDFENSSTGDAPLMKKDMHMVGELISCCDSALLSSEHLLYLHEQLLSESPPDASEALAVLAQI